MKLEIVHLSGSFSISLRSCPLPYATKEKKFEICMIVQAMYF